MYFSGIDCLEVQIKIGVKYSNEVLSGSGTHPQETHKLFALSPGSPAISDKGRD